MAKAGGIQAGFGIRFPEDPIPGTDPPSDNGEQKASRQRDLVHRLRAKGFNLAPPGYERESSNARGPSIRMLRWGNGGEGGSGSLLLNLLAAPKPEPPPSFLVRRRNGRPSPRNGRHTSTSFGRPKEET